jgi:HEAT repeat protein
MQILARDPSPQSVQLLLDWASDSSSTAHDAAVSALAVATSDRLTTGRDDTATEVALLADGLIEQASRDLSTDTRRTLAFTFGKVLSHPTHVSTTRTEAMSAWLAAALQGDGDVYVRQFAASSLGALKSSFAVRSLLVGLADPLPAVRDVTLRALRQCEQPVPLEPLLHAVESTQRDERVEALRTLDAQGARVPRAIFASSLQDADEVVRVTAGAILLRRGQSMDVEIFFHALNNPTSWEARCEAGDVLAGLVRQGDARVLERLTAIARTPTQERPDPQEYARSGAIRALGGLGPATIDLLVEFFPTQPQNVLATVDRLESPLPPQAHAVIAQLLQHPSWFVQAQAAHVLLGHQEATDEEKAQIASNALRLWADPPNGIAYDSAVQLLVRVGKAVPLPILLTLLTSIDGDERDVAILALRTSHPDLFRRGVEEARAILEGALPGPLLCPLLMSSVAEALKQVQAEPAGTGEAALILVALLRWPHPEVRRRAVIALASFGDSQLSMPHAELETLQADPYRLVRQAADWTQQQLATAEGERE